MAIEEVKRTAGPAQAAERERSMQALAALAQGRPQDAIALLEPITFDSGHSDVVSIWSIAKLLTGDLPAAAKGLTFMTSKDARTGLDSTVAFAHATLARVQAQMGQKDEARRSYEKFFELWKDADPDLPLLVQARAEFATLNGS